MNHGNRVNRKFGRSDDRRRVDTAWKTVAVLGIAALVLGLGASGLARAGDLIMNGNFTSYTTGSVPLNPTGPSQLVNDAGTSTLAQGYTSVSNWASTASGAGPEYNYTFLYTGPGDTQGSYAPAYGTETYIWGTGNGGLNTITPPPGGGNYIAMDGTSPVNTPLYQMVSGLTAGQLYGVNFNWAAGQFAGFSGATTEQWQVSLGSQTLSTPTVNNPSHGFSGWMSQTLYFTATASSETLSFLSVGGPDTLPPCALLANVSMQSVPEPSAVVLLAIGLLGIGAVSRRVRTAKRAAA